MRRQVVVPLDSFVVSGGLELGRGLKDVQQFPKGLLTILLAVAPDGRDEAGLQVVLQQLKAEPVYGPLHRQCLRENLGTVSIRFDHSEDAPDVALNRSQTGQQDGLFAGSKRN